LGTFGALATQSFHETKNFTCGEGGALLINDIRLIERAEIIREKGTNRSHFFRGEADKYTWLDVGSSYLPSDLLAACLFAQLERRNQIQAKRKTMWDYYYTGLMHWAESNQVRLPIVPDHCMQAYHMFYLLLPSVKARQALINYLKDQGILSVFHYLPLHLSPMGIKFKGKKASCPVTEDVSRRIIRLPFYNRLTQIEQRKIIKTVEEFRGSKFL